MTFFGSPAYYAVIEFGFAVCLCVLWFSTIFAKARGYKEYDLCLKSSVIVTILVVIILVLFPPGV